MMLPDRFSPRWNAPGRCGACPRFGLPALSWSSTCRLGCLPAQRRQAGAYRSSGSHAPAWEPVCVQERTGRQVL